CPARRSSDLCQLEEQRRRLVRNQVLGVVKEQVAQLERVALEAVRVRCEQVAHAALFHLSLVRLQRSPGGQFRDGHGRTPLRCYRMRAAPPDGATTYTAGVLPVRLGYSASMAATSASTASARTRLTMQPPKPAPVMRAP